MPEQKNMFESLRLSAGGGLNSAMEKVAQSQNSATIAIGLGGTGKDAIRTFKKTVYERVKQDNYEKRDTEAPKYDRIKFLVIDSDRSHVASPLQKLDLSDDYFHVGVSDIISELSDKATLNSKAHLDWFNKEIEMKNASAGAGGIRQVGKYLLSKRANDLYNKFTDMIRTAVTGLPGGFELNVYVMAGIGGGTGSGCFVDVCYIMQQALSSLGYLGSANILGFFFLPDVNLSNPDFPKGGPHEILLKKNGYAAIKELDYLMNIPRNGEEYKQAYSETFSVHQTTSPVKMCHLLSTTAVDGTVIQDGYKYIMNVVAEYALNFVVEAEEADPDGANSGITLKGIQANIDALVQAIHKNYGANYVYNILGTSCATVPYRKIGTYLAIKFFESIKYIQKYRPTKKEVEDFCQNIGFGFQRLDVQVKQGTRGLSIDASRFETGTLRSAPVGTISAPLAEFCEKWKDEYENAVTKNIATLGRALDSYEVNNNPESVIGKIFRELISIINKPELGLYYAAYMINDAQNHTLTSVLAGIRKEVENKRNYAQGQAAYRDKCETEAQAEFRSATLFVDKKKKDYVFMVEQRYKNTVEINTYTAFLGLMDKIKKHLEKIEEEYFKKLTGITDKLIETFEDNADYFNTHGMKDEMYTWSIVDIDSIKGSLDETVARYTKRTDADELVAPLLVEKFNKLMLDSHDKWEDENEIKIAELISQFIRTEFNASMTKSMKQFLQEKYGTQGQDLIKDIADKVIKDGLVAKGVPVFHSDSTMVHLTTTGNDHAEYIVLSIPNNEADFSAAAIQYKKDSGKQMGIAKNVLTDRIFMLEFFSGIPMYAYKDLQALESEYVQNPSPGLHLIESVEQNWINLPSPIPATYESTFYQRAADVQSKIDQTIALYDRAKDEEIIVEDKVSMRATIFTTPKCDLNAVFDGILTKEAVDMISSIVSLPKEQRDAKVAEVINANMWRGDRATTNMAMIKINDYINSYKESFVASEKLAAYNKIEKKGKYTNGFDSSLRDDFVMKPVFVKLIQDEIDKIDTLRAVSDVVSAIFEQLKEAGDQKGDFIRALLHSVIFKQRGNYKFNFEKRGEVTEVVLTADFDEYDTIPVYRAFVSYTKLDAEILEQIGEKTSKAAKNITDEMYDNVKDFQEFYKDSYGDYKKAAGTFENKDQIIAFLDELYDRINRFIIENK